MLTPSSMVGIWAATNRTLLSPPYSTISTLYPIVNLLHQTTSSLQKFFYKTNNKTPKLKAAIEKADINIFHRYFNNSLEDPVKLQVLVLFNLCFHCRAGREGW